MPKGTILKYFDIGPTQIASTNVYSGGATGWNTGIADGGSGASETWLTSLAQGAADSNRVGISIAVESLDVRVQITPDFTGVNNHRLRMIIFADMECQGAVPNSADLLTQATIASGAVMAFLNPSYFGRFRIIEDKNWEWTTAPSAGTPNTDKAGTHSFWHESHHDLKGHRVQWDATNGNVITDARVGHIFIYFYYEGGTGAAGGLKTIATANPPVVQYVTRIRYRDE